MVFTWQEAERLEDAQLRAGKSIRTTAK
jgi:hypothetical protein